jgi:membrane associated rhomboid family serine protease
MSEICGFGGFNITDGAGGPNQSFRFFVPIFLHAGIVHLIFNMAVQCFGSTAQVSHFSSSSPLRETRETDLFRID